MMNWERAYDIRASKNARGENVYDIYRKGTEDMVWADIPVKDIDIFLKRAVAMSEQVAQEYFDKLFSGEEKSVVEVKPMTVTYERLRQYELPFAEIINDDEVASREGFEPVSSD